MVIRAWHPAPAARGPHCRERVGVNLGVKRPQRPAPGPAKWPDLISNRLEATPGIEPGIAVLQTAQVGSTEGS